MECIHKYNIKPELLFIYITIKQPMKERNKNQKLYARLRDDVCEKNKGEN